MKRGTGRLVCLGCGYVAEALARRLLKKGWNVVGTTRDSERARLLASLGVEAIDPVPSRIAEAIEADTYLLASAAPTAEGDPFLLSSAEILAAGRNSIRWVGYLSSTSVYGDTGGAWVDEDSPCKPGFERGKRRVQAEREWRRLGDESGILVTVFRLAGIYGPGRSQLAQVRSGRARRILKPGQVFSRIHVDDIAAALEAAILGGTRAPVFNLGDDEPASTADVAAFAAQLLGVSPTPLVPLDDSSVSDRLRDMYSECRRVSNDRMKARLLPNLAYPTYREGLRAILSAEEG